MNLQRSITTTKKVLEKQKVARVNPGNGKYKLVAVDMDGTLLMPDKEIHPNTIQDIRSAVEQGIQVVYCSGRAVAELLPYTSVLPDIRYAVCMSGAVIYDCSEKRSLAVSTIDNCFVRRILETAETLGGMIHFLTESESIVCGKDLDRMDEFHMTAFQPTFRKVARTARSMREEIESHTGIPKVNIYFRNARDREAGYKALSRLPLTFAFAEETSLEMTAEGVTKASGLVWLCDYLGVPMEQTIGIGDAENDRAMLHAVGFSVAMGNAEPEIRQLCDAVTADNCHNGVGKAIRAFC